MNNYNPMNVNVGDVLVLSGDYDLSLGGQKAKVVGIYVTRGCQSGIMFDVVIGKKERTLDAAWFSGIVGA